MSLPNEPIVKMLSTHKSKVSQDDWYSYIIKLARLAYEIDGQKYDSKLVQKQFAHLNTNKSSAKRDSSKFRNESGSYGTFFGIFRYEKRNDIWTFVVSEAAKQLLCTDSPNVPAFCRAQLSLFQYPNGAGAVLFPNGTVSAQTNSLTATLSALTNNVHLNPFRLICRIVVTLHEHMRTPLSEISIPLNIYYCLMNDDRIIKDFNPAFEVIENAWTEYTDSSFKHPLKDSAPNSEIKRYANLLKKTGLFTLDSVLGIQIAQVQPFSAYSCIKTIAEMEESFNQFNSQFKNPNKDDVKNIITGMTWGQYYDAGRLPLKILEQLGVELDRPPLSTSPFAHRVLEENNGNDNNSDTNQTNRDNSTDLYPDSVDKELIPFRKTCLDIKRNKRENSNLPFNTIIYGPPGTGKTYSTVEYALAILENIPFEEIKWNSNDRTAQMEKYNQYLRNKQIVFTTFHQNYEYEDFIQGVRQDPNSSHISFRLYDGIFKRISDLALEDDKKNYVIIIDEINRGNISKVFGELITLIENDKRWGEENQTSITLQSGDIFAVPNNLYIIGTMNSADKSISLIDAALRRRFKFIEKYPDKSVISDDTLKSFMTDLNDCLVDSLENPDLLIGQSFFIGKTSDDLSDILNDNIIPLLYEYNFDNKSKVLDILTQIVNKYHLEIVDQKISRLQVKKVDAQNDS